jgi:uncharacterized membrane protein
MRLIRLVSRRWAFILWVAMLALALMLWWVQPWILTAWLGLDEFQDEGRLAILKEWSGGRLAPRTPLGLLSLFPILDLLLAVVLIAAVLVLLIRNFGPSPDNQRGSLSSEITRLWELRRVRSYFWTAVGLIALLGIGCGWEAVEWKKWHLREQYLAMADGYGASAIQCRRWLRVIHLQLARLGADAPATHDDASMNDRVSRQRDDFERRLVYMSALVKAFDELVSKYADAAKHPLQAIVPDPPFPERPTDSDLVADDYSRDHGRLLAAYDELIHSYPKSARAHQGRAWILATCPDGKYRDGRSAVASATQACELTNWHEVSALSTLAAAYAEVGNFPSAVLWEQRAGDLSAASGLAGNRKAARLALYQAGKPFHLPR